MDVYSEVNPTEFNAMSEWDCRLGVQTGTRFHVQSRSQQACAVTDHHARFTLTRGSRLTGLRPKEVIARHFRTDSSSDLPSAH